MQGNSRGGESVSYKWSLLAVLKEIHPPRAKQYVRTVYYSDILPLATLIVAIKKVTLVFNRNKNK